VTCVNRPQLVKIKTILDYIEKRLIELKPTLKLQTKEWVRNFIIYKLLVAADLTIPNIPHIPKYIDKYGPVPNYRLLRVLETLSQEKISLDPNVLFGIDKLIKIALRKYGVNINKWVNFINSILLEIISNPFHYFYIKAISDKHLHLSKIEISPIPPHLYLEFEKANGKIDDIKEIEEIIKIFKKFIKEKANYKDYQRRPESLLNYFRRNPKDFLRCAVGQLVVFVGLLKIIQKNEDGEPIKFTFIGNPYNTKSCINIIVKDGKFLDRNWESYEHTEFILLGKINIIGAQPVIELIALVRLKIIEDISMLLLN